MTIDNVTDITPRIQYVAGSGQTAFDYPFPIFANTDLVVTLNGNVLALSTDYTVSGAGNDTGGTVTRLVGSTAGQIVTIYRDMPIARTTDFQQNGPWSSDALNTELNRITLMIQQIQGLLARGLSIPITAAVDNSNLVLDPLAYASKYLSFDANGKPVPAVLTASTITTAVLNPLVNIRTPTEIAAGVFPSNYGYVEFDVRRYNIKGDGTTDDTTAWNNLGSAAWTQNITLTTPPYFNSKISGTVTLPGPYIALMMDPSSKFTYVDPGTWNTPALVIGADAQSIGNRDFYIAGISTSGNTYASENSIGLQIRGGFQTNRVRIGGVIIGFTVNIQLRGTNAGGIAYNTFDLGTSFDALYHLDVHSFAANAFINENLFLNGQIQISSGYSASRASYGIVFRFEPGAYPAGNKNHFVKPCIQITQSGVSAERIPIWFNNAGGYTQVQNARFEGLNGEVVRITSDVNAVTNILVDIGYISTAFGSISAYMTETDGGFSYNNHVALVGQLLSSTWDSGDLIQKAWAPAAGTISVLGMFLQAAASGTEVSSIASKIGKDYVLLSGAAAGVYVDTTFYKEFSVRADILATRGGRLNIVAYDVNGAQISTTRAVQFGGLSENANFGGHAYAQGADSTQIVDFRVDSTVKTIKVLIGSGTNNCAIRRLTITGYVTQYLNAANINTGMSVYGGPFAPREVISTAIPTALGGPFTQRGFVAWNGNAVAGNTVPAGWVCTAAGWNAPAWVLTTAYILNQMVLNGGNVYVCRVAGTSAGAGGPTGTGTGIVDNTVTWDYVVNGLPEPVGTNATWTALANIP